MRSVRSVAVLLVTTGCVAFVGTVAPASVRTAPGRSIVAPSRILTLGLTGRHVAFAVGETPEKCPGVELWLTESNTRYRFRWTLRGCKEGPSTGFGIPAVALARTRVLWLSAIGGNLRDWQLWTATPTKRTPRQLRFVERDVDAPAPITLGQGTVEGVPYAVDREIVYLGENGRAIFRTLVPGPVRALAADPRSRSGVVVAALLEGGRVVGLDEKGRKVIAMDVPPTASTIGLDARTGIAVQTGREIRFASGRTVLPAGARMVDLEQGRILWVRKGDLGSTTLTGRTTHLVDGSGARPAYGQLDERGLAWALGRTVRWRPGALP